MILLGYFKYLDFFLETANDIIGYSYYELPHIILPLGISFFTFTQTAYLIDAYRGDTKNRSFLTYCEFVTIFPHLIAGPIINHKEMIPQFIADKTFRINYQNISTGMVIFIMGLFKKVMIADNLSPIVSSVFSRPDDITFVEAWIGALSYTFQLYFDFSGYSEMAIGLGLIFNLTLPINFNSPYQSTNIIDFWRRWHMTLGVWVKNYLYIPLGGNRHGELNKMRNLFMSMVIIGFWHGAGWTFVLWGALHGIYLMINHQWKRLNISLSRHLSWLITFTCVTIAWVIFRSESLEVATVILSKMIDIGNIALPMNDKIIHMLAGFNITYFNWSFPYSISKLSLFLTGIFLAIRFMPNPLTIIIKQNKFIPNWKWLILALGLFLITIISITPDSEFLYFQF